MSKRSRVEQPPPEFFIDRSLGSRFVPERLRAVGLVVHVMVDVYPGLGDVEDEVWIPQATARGWVLLTKDKAIRRNDAEREAVTRAKARMFSIPSGNMTGAEMAERLADNRFRIIQRARKPGPFIYSVNKRRLEKIFPVG